MADGRGTSGPGNGGLSGPGATSPRPPSGAASMRADGLADLRPWLLELMRTVPHLVWSYVPGRGLGARSRERLIVAVADAGGGTRVAWAHAGWQSFIGDEEEGWAEGDSALLGYARACAAAGRPADTSELEGRVPPDVVSSTRATVAHAVVAARIDSAGGAVVDQLRGRTTGGPLDLVGRVALGSLGLPLVAPTLLAGLATRVAARLAPPAPPILAPAAGDGNLLVHLLADAAPRVLAHTATRTLLGLLPAQMVMAVRAGESAATLRIDRGLVTVEEGSAADAMVLIDGDIELLMRAAAGAMVRQLGRDGHPST